MRPIANRAAALPIRNREPFENHTGSFRGTSMFEGYGILPRQYWDSLNGAPDLYIVYSYQTPIGWYANGKWTIPDVKYSVTTGRHQSALRLGSDADVPQSYFDQFEGAMK